MDYSGGHKGYSISQRPKRYPRTRQQHKFKDALEFCEIKKGITKRDLQERMVNCIPQYFKEHT